MHEAAGARYAIFGAQLEPGVIYNLHKYSNVIYLRGPQNTKKPN